MTDCHLRSNLVKTDIQCLTLQQQQVKGSEDGRMDKLSIVIIDYHRPEQRVTDCQGPARRERGRIRGDTGGR